MTAQNEINLLTVSSAASYLGVSASSMRRWEKEGFLVPRRTPGNQRRYTKDQLDEFKKRNKERGHVDEKVSSETPSPQEPATTSTTRKDTAQTTLLAKTEESLRHTKNHLLVGVAIIAGTGVIITSLILSPLGGYLKAAISASHKTPALLGGSNTENVLAASTTLAESSFNVNIDSNFREDVAVDGTLTVGGVQVGTGGLSLSGTAVTSSADEINYLTGLTLDPGEMIYTDGDTLQSLDAGSSGQVLKSNGTSAPSWINQSEITAGDASTLDSIDSGSFLRSDTSDSYSSGTLTINSGTTFDVAGTFKIGSTSVTSTAAEINLLDGTTVTDGGLLFGDGTKITENQAKLSWDNTNYLLTLNGYLNVTNATNSNIDFDLTGNGDLTISKDGTPFVTYSDNGNVTIADGSLLDLSNIDHSTTGLMGLKLPQNTSFSNPISGEGYAAWDSDDNKFYIYNGSSWQEIGGSTLSGTGSSGQLTYWDSGTTFAGNNALFWDKTNELLGIGAAGAPAHKLQVSGGYGGNASLLVDQTESAGDILTASDGGTARFTIGQDGNITFTPSAYGSSLTLYASDTSVTSGDTGIIDAINSAYAAASGGSGGVWTLTSTQLYPVSTLYRVSIGSTSASDAKLVINQDTSSAILSASAGGATKLTVSNTGDITASGSLDINGTTNDIAGTLNLSGNTLTADADLLLNPTGGQVNFSDTVTLNVGGKTDLVYNAFADAADAPEEAAIDSDDDLYIGGSLEVDGTIYGTLSGGVSGTITPGFAQGAITFTDGSGNLAADVNNLYFDDTNDLVAIGHNSPHAPLHISGEYGANAALIVNQTSATSDILAASSAGSTRFKVDSSGAITASGIGKVVIVDGQKYAQTCAGINAAIDALGSTGGEVFLPEGTYTCATTITVDYNNTIIRGAGWGTIIDASAGQSFGYVINANTKDYLTLSDFQIKGNPGGGASNGLIKGGSSTTNSTFQNIFFNGSDNECLYLQYGAEDSYINNYFTACDNFAIRIDGANNRVIGNYFESVSHIAIGNNSGTDKDIENVIQGNVISGALSGVALLGSKNTVVGNYIENTSGPGIALNTGSNYNTVSGNSVVNPASNAPGISIAGDYNSITGNTVSDDGTGDNGIQIGSADYNTVIGNVVNGFSGAGDIGIYIASGVDNIISNNKFVGNNINFSDAGTNTTIQNSEDGKTGIGLASAQGVFHIKGNPTTPTGHAALIVDQYEAQDIFTASTSGEAMFTISNTGNITAAGVLDINGGGTSDIAGTLNLSGNALNATGDLVITPAGGDTTFASDILLSDTYTLQVGGATGTAYNVLGNNGQVTAQGLDGDNDLLIGDDLEVLGTIYGNITGNITGNVSGGITGGTAGSVIFLDGSANFAQDNSGFYWNDTANILQLSGGFGANSPLVVNQTEATGDLLTASQGGATRFKVSNAGAITASGIGKVVIVDGQKYAQTCAGINAAIDALGSTGGEVFLPEGTYTCAETINIDYSNTTIRGSGWGSIIDASAGQAFGSIIDFTNNVQHITFQDLKIVGNAGGGSSNDGIYVDQEKYVTVDHLWMDSLDDVAIQAVYNHDSSYLTVKNSTFSNVDGRALEIRNSGNGRIITNNIFDTIGSIAISSPGNNARISSNYFTSVTGIAIDLEYSDYASVTNNTSVGSGGYMVSTGTYGEYATITGNTSQNDAGFVFVRPGNTVISGNTIIAPTSSVNSSSAYVYDNADNVTISNNYFYGDGGNAINAIGLLGSDHVITGNIISGYSTTGSYAIRFLSSQPNTVIANNVLQNNYRDIWQWGGTNWWSPIIINTKNDGVKISVDLVTGSHAISDPVSLLDVAGTSYYNNALVTFNETGGNDILTASASGSTRFTIGQYGDISQNLSTSLTSGDGLLIDWEGATTLAGATDGINITASDINGNGQNFYGLNLSNLGTAGGGNEYGIYQQGTSWDYGAYLEDDVYIGGYLGVGGAPANRLTVTGGYGGNASLVVNQTESTGDIFSASQGGAAKFVIGNSGSVGIGDTTPDAKLDVEADTEQLRLTYASDSTKYGSFTVASNGRLTIDTVGNFIYLGGSTYYLGEAASVSNLYALSLDRSVDLYSANATHDLVLGRDGSNSDLVIDTTGNIGVNNTDPAHRLTVTGGYGGNASLVVNQTESTGDIFSASQGGNAKLTLANDGKLGILDTTPDAELDVQGSATISGTIAVGLMGLADRGTCNAASEGQMYYDKDQSKYYFCNGSSWGAVSSGATAQIVRKAVGENYGTNTLQNDDELFFTVGGTQTWVVNYYLLVDGNDIDVAIPTNSALSDCRYAANFESSDGVVHGAGAISSTCGTQLGNTSVKAVQLSGSFETDSDGGTFMLQWDDHGDAGSTTVLEGSYLIAHQITGADLAEMYYTTEPDLIPGTIIVPDNSLEAGVKKSTQAYDPKAIGVVSTKPGQVLGDAAVNARATGLPVLLGLAGRVPVRISEHSAPIKAGDYITTSDEAGLGMKATGAGRVLGMALEDWNPGDAPILEMFINPTYTLGSLSADGSYATDSTFAFNDVKIKSTSLWDKLFGAKNTDTTEGATATAEGAVDSSTPDEKEILLSEGLGKISDRLSDLETRVLLLETATASASVNDLVGDVTTADSLVVADHLDIGTLQLQENKINAVGTLAIQDLELGDVEFMAGKFVVDQKGNIVLNEGHIAGNSSFRDSVAISADDTEVTVSQEWEAAPTTINVNTSWFTQTAVVEVTENGFKVKFQTPPKEDGKLYWTAIW